MDLTLEKFEGPLALLLKMIEAEELDITTVSLAKTADQFVQYIKANPSIDPEEIADFLVVAAKLLLIKSRALLPFLYPAEDEEVDDLEKQIKMYKDYLDAAKEVDKLAARGTTMFAREFAKVNWLNREKAFMPPPNAAAGNLRMIMEDVLARLAPTEQLGESVIVDHINIEDKIQEARNLLTKKVNFFFSDFIKKASSKTEVIVGFLAILELMRQREAIIDQLDLFGEIEVKPI
jgi:segregation and condensation protein A